MTDDLFPPYRNVQRARWQDRWYAAAGTGRPDDRRVVLYELPGAVPAIRVAEVSPGDLDEWVSVRYTMVWRGRSFTITKVLDDGRLVGTLHGGARGSTWAQDNGLIVAEHDHVVGYFRPDEADEIVEHRTDLLAKETTT